MVVTCVDCSGLERLAERRALPHLSGNIAALELRAVFAALVW
jgi:hypothetical protein